MPVTRVDGFDWIRLDSIGFDSIDSSAHNRLKPFLGCLGYVLEKVQNRSILTQNDPSGGPKWPFWAHLGWFWTLSI